ncbi:MAG: 3-hydroxyacyl-CoA dehydrogenase family protein [Nisaea sp.]|uniref:3-hydroxyacyl-CoA dehydrogenase family protein n=1 Tax=Nisaea sp. TaxID=2024842 RepID=UPI001B2AB334|nr:3-hydroxyacyl-CoA dehydrogenase family protein [Nisaea sp.]MBO6560932.1 3-hydroxyacyl-CoA dehydrogenase family protein [Nisaea sp.]
MDSTSKVAIIGAGLMGHGLALVHAIAGHPVKMTDISERQLKTGMELIGSALETLVAGGSVAKSETAAILARITPVATLKDAVADADFIVEAVVENREVKTTVYAELESAAPAAAIIASNTSYLDAFPLAPASLQSRFIITHWYTPPYIIDLVDIAGGPETDRKILEAVRDHYAAIGKKPVLFERFVPGYVANRLQAAMTLEITRLLDEGYADAEAIDTSIKYGLALRMATMGALMKADFTGLDMSRRALANKMYIPPEVKGKSETLEKLIADGKQGVMNGSGYFDYGDMKPEELFRNRDVGLLKLKAAVEKVEEELPLRPKG